jgi:hypothetical protein
MSQAALTTSNPSSFKAAPKKEEENALVTHLTFVERTGPAGPVQELSREEADDMAVEAMSAMSMEFLQNCDIDPPSPPAGWIEREMEAMSEDEKEKLQQINDEAGCLADCSGFEWGVCVRE